MNYRQIPLSLAAARVNPVPIETAGDIISFWELNPVSRTPYVDVALDEPTNAFIRMRFRDKIKGPFKKFFIRHQDAFAGTNMAFLVGQLCEMDLESGAIANLADEPSGGSSPSSSGVGDASEFTGVTMSGALGRALPPDPAAGADWSYTIPTGEVWEIMAVIFRLVTDATVTTRNVRVYADGGTVPPIRYWMGNVNTGDQPGSRDRTWVFSDIDAANVNNDNPTVEPIASMGFVNIQIGRFIVAGGDRIRIVTSNIQAADQFSDIVIHFRRA